MLKQGDLKSLEVLRPDGVWDSDFVVRKSWLNRLLGIWEIVCSDDEYYEWVVTYSTGISKSNLRIKESKK